VGRWREAPNHEVVHTPVFAAPDTFPLAGYHEGHFFLRDPEDRFRFFPGALLQIDARAAGGRGVTELEGSLGDPLRPRVSVRRAQPMLGGQIGSEVSYLLSGELAGPKPRVEYALVDLAAHRLLHITVGQQLVPFTMAGRTYEAYQSWMEQPLVVRFARPVDKDLGVLLWGDLPRSLFTYEAGVFGGDGAGRPNVDNRVDLAGRVTLRPLARTDSIANRIQIGASATYGVRQINNVGYHLDALTTDGGFAFWDGGRTEGGQRVAVLPSGEQLGLAGELRVPVSKLDFRFEFLYQKRNTRESVEGLEQSQSVRFGHLTGTGFYTQLAFWILGDPTMIPEPGRFQPPRIHFPRGERHPSDIGLNVALRVESLSATYAPGDRASLPGDARPEQSIEARVVGVGVNYLLGRHAQVSVNYAYTVLPGSGVAAQSPSNAAVTPGNLAGHSGAHQLHEAGGRVQVSF
jgi:hypothetical protein